MNAASWVILAIVVACVALAIKATFFKKKSRGGCCDTGDAPSKKKGESCCETASVSRCTACSACDSCATARNALTVTYKEVR